MGLYWPIRTGDFFRIGEDQNGDTYNIAYLANEYGFEQKWGGLQVWYSLLKLFRIWERDELEKSMKTIRFWPFRARQWGCACVYTYVI